MENHFEHTKQNHVQGKAHKAPMFHERLKERFEELPEVFFLVPNPLI